MISKNCINFRYLKAAFLRRFWCIILPFFAVFIATVGYCIKAPRVYKAETLILVERQKVPGEHIRSTVTVDLGNWLRTITRQIKNRARLEKIIKDYDLYSNIRVARTMTDAVEVFQKGIEINVTGSNQRSAPDSFEIAYMSDDPVKARDITNAIATLFVEDNLKLRKSRVTGSATFLDGELERMKKVLLQKEEQLCLFEEEYLGLMPEQMENKVLTPTELQQELDSINATIHQAEERKILLQTQLSGLEAALAGSRTAVGQDRDPAADQAPLTLEELRLQLKSLKSRYSDKHPDVIRLAATIAKREKEPKESTTFDSDTKGTSIRPPTSEARRLTLVQREDFLSQLKLIDKQLATLAKKKKKTRSQIAEHQQRIEEGPKIAQMLVDLRQDWRKASENYQSFLEKRLRAQLSENLEGVQQAEQFRILEPATLPEKPFKPNPRKILALGFMMALVCGFGLAFSREYLDPAFWSSKELESVVDLPVLVSIPTVNTKKECRWNILKRAGAAGVLVSMASVLFYALFILWKMDRSAFQFPLG